MSFGSGESADVVLKLAPSYYRVCDRHITFVCDRTLGSDGSFEFVVSIIDSSESGSVYLTGNRFWPLSDSPRRIMKGVKVPLFNSAFLYLAPPNPPLYQGTFWDKAGIMCLHFSSLFAEHDSAPTPKDYITETEFLVSSARDDDQARLQQNKKQCASTTRSKNSTTACNSIKLSYFLPI